MPGAPADAGTAWLDVLPRLGQGFRRRLESDVDGAFAGLRSKGAALGKMLAVGVGAGLVAGGAGLAAAALTIDDAIDTIRVGTGATGDALKGLTNDMREVAKQVPSSIGDVGTAIADLNTRTGQSGESLQALAKQFLDLSRLTGTDLKTNIASLTRVFGDWGIATEDQSATLDKIYRASQATGIGIDQLGESVVKFGAPLRQMGFGFEESIALLGKFEKEGVNSELVMGSLRIALGKLARAGKEPVQAFREQVAAIKAAGDAGEANALALELFGARAGPDMAAAIREGRFEIDALFDAVSQGDTIARAVADTDDLAESFGRLRNKVVLAVQPIALKGLELATKAFDALVPKVELLGRSIAAGFSGKALDSAGMVASLHRVGEAMRVVVSTIREGVDIISAAFAGSPTDGLEGWWAVLAQVGAVARSVFDYLRDNGREVLIALGVLVAGVVVPAFVAWAAATIAATWPVVALAAAVVGVIKLLERFPVIAQVVGDVARWVGEQFTALAAWTAEVWPQIQEAVTRVVNILAAIWRDWGDEIVSVAKAAWAVVHGAIETALGLIRGAIEFALAVINDEWGRAWDMVKSVLVGALASVVDSVAQLPGRILGALGNLGSLLVDAGRNLIEGLIGGITSMAKRAADAAWNVVKGAVRSAWDAIVPGSPSKVGTAIGINFGEGIAQGLTRSGALLDRAVPDLIDHMTHAFDPGVGVLMGAAAGMVPAGAGADIDYDRLAAALSKVSVRGNVVVDGRELGHVVDRALDDRRRVHA